jgi:ribA/ribD-fused uncharacterized protein
LSPAKIDFRLAPWDSAEQVYQYVHAVMGSDTSVAQEIRADTSNDGFCHKKLGDKIKDLHPFMWQSAKILVMYRVDYEKYSQNAHLKSYLLGTGNHDLIEAVWDLFWGGLRGENNAGKILVNLREYFRGNKGALPEIIIAGDSIIKGVDDSVISRALNRTVACVSLSGATFGYVSRLCRYVAGPYVSKLLLFAGTNSIANRDGESKQTPSSLIRKLRSFENAFCNECPGVQLTVSQVLNRPCNVGDEVEAHVAKYNRRLSQLAADGQLNALTKILELPEFPVECYDHSGLHLNEIGTERLTAMFVSFFMQNIT